MRRRCFAGRVELAPAWTSAKANLALVLGRMGRPAEALGPARRNFRGGARPDRSLEFQGGDARPPGRFRRGDPAVRSRCSSARPTAAGLAELRSYAEDRRAAQEEGIAAYRKAIALRPSLGEAWWSLANLKTVKFDDADIVAMQHALEAPGLADEDRFHLEFALGKAMHDLGRTDERSLIMQRGNALRLKSRPYRSRRHQPALSTAASRHSLRERSPSGGGCDARDPIFIVGLPRSGSTLIEQILSSATARSRGRPSLPDIPALARESGPYPEAAFDLSADERRALGEEYLKRVAPFNGGRAARSSSTSYRTTGSSSRSSS